MGERTVSLNDHGCSDMLEQSFSFYELSSKMTDVLLFKTDEQSFLLRTVWENGRSFFKKDLGIKAENTHNYLNKFSVHVLIQL